MALENAEYIPELVPSNPPGTDFVLEGDNHVRMLKDVLQKTFPGVPTGPIINAGENPSEPSDALTAPDNLMMWSPKAIADFVKKYWADWGLVPPVSSAPCFRVGLSVSRTVTGSPAKIDWDDVAEVDDGIYWDSANNRFIPTNGVTSRWLVNAQLQCDTSVNGGLAVYIRKNGTTVKASEAYSAQGNRITPRGLSFVECNGIDDYVEIFSSWNAGTETVGGQGPDWNYFEVTYIGPAP